TAPAILNAIYHATGVRLRRVPATPDRVRAALKEAAMTEAPRKAETDIITCDACPVLCRIRPGKSGACDRYANIDGVLTRTDPMLLVEASQALVPFLESEWDGSPAPSAPVFVTGIGSGTTYPDYKPAPFIVSSRHRGVDTVTVVTEAIFSYCGAK